MREREAKTCEFLNRRILEMKMTQTKSESKTKNAMRISNLEE